MSIDLFSNTKILQSLIVIVAGYLLRSLIIKLFHKNMKDMKAFYKTKRVINYIYFFILVLVMFSIWTDFTSFSTYFGLASAGIAIALSDLLINIAAFLFILVRRPFVVGDRIEIDNHAGDVIDQRLFQFTIMEIGNWVHNDQSTGRMIHIPNSKVFKSALFNYSSGFKFIWHEVHVLLTFESDYKKAKDLFLEIAKRHSVDKTDKVEKEIKEASKKYMVFYNKLTPIVYTDVKDSGVMLSLRYLCSPHERRTSNQGIWEEILDVVKDHDDISLAYNTLRMVKED